MYNILYHIMLLYNMLYYVILYYIIIVLYLLLYVLYVDSYYSILQQYILSIDYTRLY